jgi:hypothetical protein
LKFLWEYPFFSNLKSHSDQKSKWKSIEVVRDEEQGGGGGREEESAKRSLDLISSLNRKSKSK